MIVKAVSQRRRYIDLPIALPTAILLGLGRISVGMARLGKVTRKPRLTLSAAIGNAGVVTVSPLVRASHYKVSAGSITFCKRH